MPFGLSVAPGHLTKVLKPAIATLRSMAIWLVIWLNDILIISSSKETCVKHAKIVITLLQSLGFVINFAKSDTCSHTRVGISGNDSELSNIKFLSLTKENCGYQGKAFGFIQNRNSVSVTDVCQFIGMCNATQLEVTEAEAIQSSKEPNLQQANLSESSVSPRADMVAIFSSRCSIKANKSPPSRLYFAH